MSWKEEKSIGQEEYRKHERVDDQDGREISVQDLGLTLYLGTNNGTTAGEKNHRKCSFQIKLPLYLFRRVNHQYWKSEQRLLANWHELTPNHSGVATDSPCRQTCSMTF